LNLTPVTKNSLYPYCTLFSVQVGSPSRVISGLAAVGQEAVISRAEPGGWGGNDSFRIEQGRAAFSTF
jgi:hypothetical protein